MPETIAELLGFLVRSVFSAEAAVFAEFKLLRSSFLVLCSCVISLLALSAAEIDYISHWNYPLSNAVRV